jgi:F-type H+-transporting ATPase subunit a
LIVLNLLPIPPVFLPEAVIAAEPVLQIGGLTITNSLLASWLTMIILVVGMWAITRRLRMVPGRWQAFVELIIEGFYGLVENAAGAKWARKFFPIVMTIFLFILVSNWVALTPIFGSWGPLHESDHGHDVQWLNQSETVGVLVESPEGHGEAEGSAHEGAKYGVIPFFRAATTDLNVTLALALISVLLTQYFGVKALGIGYFGKFFAFRRIGQAFTKPGLGCGGRIGTFGMGIIDIFTGIVELISELGKIISFSFRLFGNIFAGEVLLFVMAFLFAYIVSLPFYGLEIFVGFVQALVFMMLTTAFFVVAISSHGEEEH